MNPDESVVFVIDDDPYMRDSLVGLLRSLRQRVESFDSTEAFLHSTLPDLPACLVLRCPACRAGAVTAGRAEDRNHQS